MSDSVVPNLVRMAGLRGSAFVAAVAFAALAGGAASALADPGSSVPVSADSVAKKKAELARSPEPVKPDGRKQLGSSVPVAEPIWIDGPEPGSRAIVPNVIYPGDRRLELSARYVGDSMSSSHGGQASLSYMTCVSPDRLATCVEWEGSAGQMSRGPDGKLITTARGSVKVRKGFLHLGASVERDVRFRQAYEIDPGVILASNKLATSLRVGAGYGILWAHDSRDAEQGAIGKAELESYLGRHVKLAAAVEGGKYTNEASRVRTVASVRFTTGQTRAGENPRWRFFVEPSLIHDSSKYKAVEVFGSPETSPLVERKALTGVVSIGAAVQ